MLGGGDLRLGAQGWTSTLSKPAAYFASLQRPAVLLGCESERECPLDEKQPPSWTPGAEGRAGKCRACVWEASTCPLGIFDLPRGLGWCVAGFKPTC